MVFVNMMLEMFSGVYVNVIKEMYWFFYKNYVVFVFGLIFLMEDIVFGMMDVFFNIDLKMFEIYVGLVCVIIGLFLNVIYNCDGKIENCVFFLFDEVVCFGYMWIVEIVCDVGCKYGIILMMIY